MNFVFPWIISALGLVLSWYWGKHGVPKSFGPAKLAPIAVGVFFGLWALESDELIRGGYFTEYGDIDQVAPFLMKPAALYIYVIICNSLMGPFSE